MVTPHERHTDTASTAWDEQKPLYGCFWDMKKAFDSVSKPVILFCWQRLGVSLEIGPESYTTLTIFNLSVPLSKAFSGQQI